MVRGLTLVAILATGLLASCVATIPKDALVWDREALATRQLQTRSFETKDERALLVAAAGLLQDMGYTIEESEVPLGLLVGSKERDATEAGQVVGAVFVAVLFGSNPGYDKVQKIRASLITRDSDINEGQTLLRVTFQRLVWNNKGVLWKREPIEDVEVYESFFDRLGKAVFLEAQKI